MILRNLILVTPLFYTTANAQEDGGGCSVCGEGQEVGNKDAIFSFPGQPALPCAVLELAGEQGLIPLSQCNLLPPLIEACECQRQIFIQPTNPPVADPAQAPVVDSTVAPVVNPTQAPLPVAPTPVIGVPTPLDEPSLSPIIPTSPPTATNAPTAPYEGCSVCRDGWKVNDSDAVFSILGQPSIPCGDLELAGQNGMIPHAECLALPQLIVFICDCQPIDFIATLDPSRAPVLAPITPAPTARPPTHSPIVTVSMPAPIDEGTFAPVPNPTLVTTIAPVRIIGGAPVVQRDPKRDPTSPPVRIVGGAPVVPTRKTAPQPYVSPEDYPSSLYSSEPHGGDNDDDNYRSSGGDEDDDDDDSGKGGKGESSGDSGKGGKRGKGGKSGKKGGKALRKR